MNASEEAVRAGDQKEASGSICGSYLTLVEDADLQLTRNRGGGDMYMNECRVQERQWEAPIPVTWQGLRAC